jgi:hypothetical protein
MLRVRLLWSARKNRAFKTGDGHHAETTLEYDSVALAVLFIGLGVVELLALSF